ncbi:helix-turn-helix domain-containing protein [Pelotomaculum terephthalicicum JT]|uniref:helix-turn-helix domain-containing protein n=1 Tax=Pelotomaculum TaxID=191373 RepID=UPI0009CBC35D|nr:MULTISPECIES: helix-turn-helix domain-containing protein [Pelotomaculum]MCG9969876.1 helix-turn-helix domain-containing protein [Pelotomaculum terephthalicicum JT]OPX87263.1 MAG: Helix-turn-helix domain protein [Pelotomaculum sp. PtaB.Bin117]OPY60366.1 MAG: Helix-turn-helix domain protein [Pelotomaculum sp. PtaU1.Bin065]
MKLSSVSNDNALLTVLEVAIILRVSKATVYRMIQRGQLKAHRIGGSIRIKQVDIDDLFSDEKKASE